MPIHLGMTGLDIMGEPDENDKRSLAEVAALEASDRFVTPTRETTEKYLQMRQENTQASRGLRFEAQDELTRWTEDRIGHVLSENEFIRRIRKLVPVLVNDWSARGMRGISAWKDGRYEYIGALQCGYMPEYSLLQEDAHEVPTAEKYRGWRGTVLLRLILGGFISEAAAHAEFGPPTLNRASLQYRKKLYHYRNRSN